MAIELTTATTSQLSGIRQSLEIPIPPEIFPNATFIINGSTINIQSPGGVVNLNAIPKKTTRVALDGLGSLDTILGGSKLTELQDSGTGVSVNISGNQFSASTLNQLFTDLPATNKTATIRVVGNPGSATCDPTIATAKGYTVVTS